MQLVNVHIKNFRGIADLSLDLGLTTVLIGENNTGKSSILDALYICLNKALSRRSSPFTEYDFHLADKETEVADAPPIEITLTFEEAKKDEWPEEASQAFDKAMQVLADGRQRLTFKVSARFDKDTGDFAIEWSFLDKDGNVLPTAKNPKLVADLQQFCPLFLLSAVRDAAQHFHAKSAFWGPFTKNIDVPADKRIEIESQIEAVNKALLDSHKPFESAKESVARTGKLVPLADGDVVNVQPVPARLADMLAKTQVMLGARTGAHLPVTHHGSGTQSLAVLFLFEAFLKSRLKEVYDKHSSAILALEEPESHLHPSAVRALWRTIDGFHGQKVVASHSGDLLASVPLKAVRRVARKNNKVEVFKVGDGTLDADDERKVSFHIRSKRGSLLLARCWLLVEGESDFSLLTALAGILEKDFDEEGVACVDFQASGGVKPLIKVANDLGIEWHLLSDGDDQGKNDVKAAKALLHGREHANHITQLDVKDIEHLLWSHGYSAIYESAVSPNRRKAFVIEENAAGYEGQVIEAAVASTSKPFLAFAVAEEAKKRGTAGVPPPLSAVVAAAVKLARASK